MSSSSSSSSAAATTLSKPRLTYFNGRGLGEFCRMVLAAANVDYEDRRVDDIKDLKSQLNFGQVPLYETPDGLKLNQSGAIARFIAASHGLYGANVSESARIDMIVDGLGDVRAKYFVHRALPADQQDAAKAKFGTETLIEWLGYFERILSENNHGQGFFVGNKLSLADITFFVVSEAAKTWNADAFKNFPLLAGLCDRVAANANIAAWLKKRPVSAW